MAALIDYKNFSIKLFPFPKSKIIQIDNFIDPIFLNNIKEEILLLNHENNLKKFKISGKSDKIEFLDYSLYGDNSLKLVHALSDKKFTNYLQKSLNISDELFPDVSNGFSGFNIVKKNGFLKTHADFNYNNNLKKYRTINLLIYFNNDWK